MNVVKEVIVQITADNKIAIALKGTVGVVEASRILTHASKMLTDKAKNAAKTNRIFMPWQMPQEVGGTRNGNA